MQISLKNIKSRFAYSFDPKILLVRHGESIFNKEMRNLQNLKNNNDLYLETKKHIKFTNRLFDSDLTETGHQQCSDVGEKLRNLKFKYAFVSPLRRALKTCSGILTGLNHVPKVIVCPYLFEKIEDNCDFMLDINNNMKLFPYDWSHFQSIDLLPIYYFISCDNYINEKGALCKTQAISHKDKINNLDNYYINTIIKNNYLNNKQKLKDFILKEITKLDNIDQYIESSNVTFERNKIFNEFLQAYISDLKDDEKILVVGHSIFFKHLTLLEYVEECFKTNNFAYLKNCEIVGYNL